MGISLKLVEMAETSSMKTKLKEFFKEVCK
jgi:hypothetical protein